MLKVVPAVSAMNKGQLTGPRGEVPVRTYFHNSASEIGLQHTVDGVLPLIKGLHGFLYSRLKGFADLSSRLERFTQACPITLFTLFSMNSCLNFCLTLR